MEFPDGVNPHRSSCDDSAPIDDSFRAPAWIPIPGLRPRETRPAPTSEEHLRWKSEPHQTQPIDGPVASWLHYQSMPFGYAVPIPHNTAQATDNGHGPTSGGVANEQDENTTSSLDTEDYGLEDPTSESSDEFSDGLVLEDEAHTYLSHNESLRGVVEGVICEFTPQNASYHLNTIAPWFPYMRYPFSFRWGCCDAAFSDPCCRRNLPAVPEPSTPDGHVSASSISSGPVVTARSSAGTGTSSDYNDASESDLS
ncbi:hypothetical protein F4825DRAFT_65786 [Nemania diffusa]|nr:hypothetical protein F4825DRAFT_65786 [Nemania diffusa]